jgi:cysteinyl-tRNA synthetase
MKIMIKLYDTLTRAVKEFKPLSQSEVKLYSCGPTVYDYQHIGNFRKFVFDDTLRRTLESLGYNVVHVMNITDVGHLVSDADEGEDKLEKGARREGKTVWEVAQHYTNAFKKDAKKLNILDPNGYRGEKDNYARATDFIEEQINLIKILMEKDFAYVTEKAIYFDVSKLPDYGILSGQKLSEKEVGVRDEVVTDSNKRNPQDFAVWFFLKGRYEHHSMHWLSPWGKGFPGWHLECSAIIHKLLGDPIDIHTGGVDHIGVHHTNEMAQTEAAYGNKLANYWMHSEHLLVDGQKMSKSLGNFYTLKDIEEKGFDPLALRLLYLQGHYRTQTNFTRENLEAANNRLKSYRAFADLLWELPDESTGPYSELQDAKQMIIDALSDDLDTPKALSILSTLESQWLGILTEGRKTFREFLDFIDSVLGLDLSKTTDISDEQYGLISEREEARKNQDWQKADELRSQLRERGIEINDTDQGPIWHRA